MATFRLPNWTIPISGWRWSSWAGTLPPVGAPAFETLASLTPGQRQIDQSSGFVAFILIDITTDIRFCEDGIFTTFPAPKPDIVEVPTGSGMFYKVVDVERSGYPFANRHLVATIAKASPWPVGGTPPPPTGDLLLEDGTSYLLEDGTTILLE